MIKILTTIVMIFSIYIQQKPVVRMIHGLLAPCFIEQEFLNENFKDYDKKCIESGNGLIFSFESQIKEACVKLNHEAQILKKGFTLIGISQGGLIARAIVEKCEVGIYVKRLITIGGPHMGVAAVPNLPPKSPANFIVKFCSNKTVRSLVGPCGYITSLVYHQFDKLNHPVNELNNTLKMEQSYKQNLENLDVFMAIGFEDDTVIQPNNSAVFGYFNDDKYQSYAAMEDLDIYKQDRIGLKKLNEEGKLFRCVVPGNHLQLGSKYTEKLVVNFGDYRNEDYKKHLDDIKNVCRFTLN